jgi:WS/DGAT/MGAT family acyltransferase
MKQLSGADAMFLQLERANNFMHVASLAIYDPSTAPGGAVRFKDVLRFFATRVAQFPQFRRRLVTLPFGIDRPYWLEAASIDVEFHVRHIALPAPGDWRQLCIQVARLHARPLDRSKPLWEAYVIEGLDNVAGTPAGSFALYTKMHHAIVDGESGTEIMRALHTLAPEKLELGDESHDAGAVYHADVQPTSMELYSRALLNNVERLPAMARLTLDTSRKLGSLAAESLRSYRRSGEGGLADTVKSLLSGDLGALLPRLPQTRFTGDVSAHRVFEAVSLPMADFRKVKRRVPQATVNDQFLAIVGGALRAYLSDKGELPEASMVAGVPMTLRGDTKGGDRGNQVGMTFVAVHTDIEDPIERLEAVCESAARSKRLSDQIGREIARDVMEALPSLITDPLLGHVKLPKIGLVVSNVRGPDAPLYMAGAQLVNYVPISIVIDGIGLNITGFSYAGRLWICAVSCREILPEPAFFADCLRASAQQLSEAVDRDRAFGEAAADAEPKPRRKAAKRRTPQKSAAGAPAMKSKAAAAKRKSATRKRPASPGTGAA